MFKICEGDKVFHKQYDQTIDKYVYECLTVKSIKSTPEGHKIILESDQIVFDQRTGTRTFDTYDITLFELRARLWKDLFLCRRDFDNV